MFCVKKNFFSYSVIAFVTKRTIYLTNCKTSTSEKSRYSIIYTIIFEAMAIQSGKITFGKSFKNSTS